MFGRRIATTICAITLTIPLLATGAPVSSHPCNWTRHWESLAGAKHHARTQIIASCGDKGRHAKRGYHRFQRKAGPKLDTGRRWTPTASGPWDKRKHQVYTEVWDSPLWGDKYTTRLSWDYIYFK